jgi:hypothetical protein
MSHEISRVTLRQYMPLKDAADLFPEALRPSTATLIDWTRRGRRGIKLQSRKILGQICTTEADVLAFVAAVDGADSPQ